MQLQQEKDELERLGVTVLVVTFQGGASIDMYRRDTRLNWPILLDESLQLYGAYGMARGRWQDVFGLASWWIYLKLLLRGRRLQRSTGDVRQLGGNVLVDPANIVRYHHVGGSPADRPDVKTLLDVVRQSGAS